MSKFTAKRNAAGVWVISNPDHPGTVIASHDLRGAMTELPAAIERLRKAGWKNDMQTWAK